MPLFTQGGKYFFQDTPGASAKEVNASVGGTYDTRVATPLPTGLTTIPLGGSVDTGSGPQTNNGLVPRYDVPGSTSPNADGSSQGFVDSEQAKLFAAGGIYGNTAAPDPAAIRANILGQAQAQIDGINKAADTLVAQENNVNAPNRLGQARALAARSGNLGSSFYESGQKPQVEQKNAEAMAAIENDRQTKINVVMNTVNAEAQQETQAKVAEARGNADAYVNFLKDSQERTRQGVKDLATSGVSFDALSTSPDYAGELNNILKYGNFANVHDLEAFFNASKPAAQKIDYQTEIIKGDNGNATILRYGIDPVTGQMSTQKGDTGINYDTFKGNGSQLKEVNGEFFLFNPADNTLKPLGGNPANSSKYGNGGGGTPPVKAGALTAAQYNKLNGLGIDKADADALTSQILGGMALDQIRQKLRDGGVDPAVLDNFDRVVGIATLLKNKNASTSSSSSQTTQRNLPAPSGK